VATTADEYSVKRRIDLPQDIHGEPYIFTVDSERYNVKIRLMGKYSQENISEFAMLPEFKIKREGFNPEGDVSVGNTFSGMNTSSAIIISKTNGSTTISAVI
jgi:hypothetical protein